MSQRLMMVISKFGRALNPPFTVAGLAFRH
jgi:hypothetical protein